MALEMGAYGIRVNSICLGLIKSGITGDLMDQDWVRNVARRTIRLRTFGESDPGFTSLVRYLLHDSSD
ncbi:hypothetical protein AXF42_Ash004570 [Apostasia shenzhenica]|uniref:Uncharacterized protein n=1 Tax=Apostasia shenzhenica TaxID=1088818 RepID=A0A2I0BH16_9ASPA|nr:hypothetical protein AXF42_Ash004570 [Apostasia shenzhenica]